MLQAPAYISEIIQTITRMNTTGSNSFLMHKTRSYYFFFFVSTRHALLPRVQEDGILKGCIFNLNNDFHRYCSERVRGCFRSLFIPS